ncbi:MAG TPA: DoxX family protein [Alphaproteobacteria bacterium]|jgi:putative oxidoreductase|nr:DoxX family protein [Alphaproteobacteria bacterium]
MSDRDNHPKLLIPALAPFYAIVEHLSYPIVRVTAGLMLLPHGWPKLFGGVERFAEGLERRGFEPALPFAYLVALLETGGGILVAIGLLTRPIAAAIAIQMAIITFGVHWFDGRHELPLMWGLIMFAIALRGGGPYSLDRKLGREI